MPRPKPQPIPIRIPANAEHRAANDLVQAAWKAAREAKPAPTYGRRRVPPSAKPTAKAAKGAVPRPQDASQTNKPAAASSGRKAAPKAQAGAQRAAPKPKSAADVRFPKPRATAAQVQIDRTARIRFTHDPVTGREVAIVPLIEKGKKR